MRCWTFEDDTDVIRIGRATDNDIVLYSAVVSRHHLAILKKGDIWELENLGTNGTFCNGERIKKTAIADGMIFSLAGSGPKIQIYLGAYQSPVDGTAKPTVVSTNPIEEGKDEEQSLI